MSDNVVKPQETTPASTSTPAAPLPPLAQSAVVDSAKVNPAGPTAPSSTETSKTDVVPPTVPVSTAGTTPPASKPPQKRRYQLLFAVVGLLILLVGSGVGFVLMQRSAEIRQQAAVAYADCPNHNLKHGQTICSGFQTIQQCQNGVLVNYSTCGPGKRCAGTPNATCVDNTASPTPAPSVAPSPGSCQPLGAACDDVTNLCCTGGTCQGVGTNRRCEAKQDTCNDPNSDNDGVCGGNQGWLGFRCNNLTNGQCLENSQTFNNYQDAYNYASANGCGQVDEVCVGGWKNRQLCGSFQVIASNCGGSIPTPQPSPQPSPHPTPTPGVTPSPVPSPSISPTPTPAPVCAYIAVNKANIVVGDNVTFTCGLIPGASRYEFRVRLPDGTITNLSPEEDNSNISESFQIAQQGDYKAQCRICVGPGACQEWEAL